MQTPIDRARRRALVKFLCASPLMLAASPVGAVEELIARSGTDGSGAEPDLDPVRELIASAREAVNVFDFQPVAKQKLLPGHYTFLSMGVEDEVTLRANRSDFDDFRLRPRRLVDASDLDTTRELLGTSLSCPIFLCPVGAQRAFDPRAELAVAEAARRIDHLQILSTASSTPIEQVVAARGAPVWFQLYTADLWPITRRQLRSAEEAGCPAVALTVDNISVMFGQNREKLQRHRRDTNPQCQSCHESLGADMVGGVVRFADAIGFDLETRLANLFLIDWDYVDRIRDATSMKLLIKGILTREDASLCVEHGVDGLIVSNHGGRAIDTGLSTIAALPEIVEEVDGRIPVLVDSGFRRGTDVFKALALGADAVGIGRPYIWGLSAFGQEGVEAVLELMRGEFELTMKGMGSKNLASISSEQIERRPFARQPTSPPSSP